MTTAIRPALTQDEFTRLATQAKLDANEDAAERGQALPWCDATDRDGNLCLKVSTGDTDYCRKHEDNPQLNWSVNDQCAHENWAGKRCRVRVWPHGSICPRHRECDCDACQTGQNAPGERC